MYAEREVFFVIFSHNFHELFFKWNAIKTISIRRVQMRIVFLGINISIKWPWLKWHTQSNTRDLEVNTINVVSSHWEILGWRRQVFPLGYQTNKTSHIKTWQLHSSSNGPFQWKLDSFWYGLRVLTRVYGEKPTPSHLSAVNMRRTFSMRQE